MYFSFFVFVCAAVYGVIKNNNNAQGLNLMRGRSLGGSRTADINDEQTDRFLNEDLNELKLRMKIRKKTERKQSTTNYSPVSQICAGFYI